jgi:hypothetical protein
MQCMEQREKAAPLRRRRRSSLDAQALLLSVGAQPHAYGSVDVQ